MSASDGGHVEVLRLLLEAGADMDLADDCGWTALMHAIMQLRGTWKYLFIFWVP